MPFDPTQPLGPEFRQAVGAAITAFLDRQGEVVGAVGPEVTPLLDQARHFTGGGKRFRPAFLYWGYAAGAGQPGDAAPVLRAAASLDLLHVSALAHDDVMDDSDTRRGGPAAHVVNARLHAENGWRGGSEAFGRAGAILLGDLLLMWSAEMWASCGLEPEALARAQATLDAVRTEVTLGQYLDIVAQHADTSLERARRVTEFKSARYTVTRPVQLGALLSGAPAATVAALGAYGSPVGRAFQMRDDLLGVFGDEAVTGKPAGDDLREGKRTVLIAHALEAVDAEAATRLESLLGDPALDPAGVDEARAIIRGSGAVDQVEADIATDHAAALAVLSAVEIDDEARTALEALASLAVSRDA